jgi:hypothetical protein
MRKIEQQMLNAIESKRNWQSDNTLVHIENGGGNPFGLRAEIYLHGNHIADYWYDAKQLDVDTRTLIDWNTRTTKSRLRALGAKVATRKGIIYLNNVAINKGV